MRVMVLFDLPMVSSADLREYRRFRRFLIKEGFVMLQQSIYTKITLNAVAKKAVKRRVYENKPKEGLVQMLVVTEKQYNSMEFVVGSSKSEVIQSDERLVIL